MVADFRTFSRLAGIAASERAWPEGGRHPTSIATLACNKGHMDDIDSWECRVDDDRVTARQPRPFETTDESAIIHRPSPPATLENAKERGTLAGEVRVLKWGAGIAIVAILGGLGMLYQNHIVLHQRVVQVEERVVRVEEHLVRVEEHVMRVEEHVMRVEERVMRVEERVARVEERVARVEERLDSIDKHLATISAQLATLTSRQIHSP